MPLGCLSNPWRGLHGVELRCPNNQHEVSFLESRSSSLNKASEECNLG